MHICISTILVFTAVKFQFWSVSMLFLQLCSFLCCHYMKSTRFRYDADVYSVTSALSIKKDKKNFQNWNTNDLVYVRLLDDTLRITQIFISTSELRIQNPNSSNLSVIRNWLKSSVRFPKIYIGDFIPRTKLCKLTCWKRSFTWLLIYQASKSNLNKVHFVP